MMGAIAGDVIGSVFEGRKHWLINRTPHFAPLFNRKCRFTDDTVLTVAVAEHLLDEGDLTAIFKDYYSAYPSAGYGGTFRKWAKSKSLAPYNSYGNGSAMRVSPVGYAYDSLEEVLLHAKRTAAITHNHPEGVKGAQATAAAIWLARQGNSKAEIRDYIERKFQYELLWTVEDLRPSFGFDVTCQGTVPPALMAFFDSTDYESAVRLAISLGGDADTLACIAGSVAEAFYGSVPDSIREETLARLDEPLITILNRFEERFGMQSTPQIGDET